MKVIVFILTFMFCDLTASCFLRKEILDTSLEDSFLQAPRFSDAVGTIFPTNLAPSMQVVEQEPSKAQKLMGVGSILATKSAAPVSFTAATCFAISSRHLLCNADTLRLIPDLKDCYITMSGDIGFAIDALPIMMHMIGGLKVSRIFHAPDEESLVVLALDRSLDVSPLRLGGFKADSGKILGISTTEPTLLGQPQEQISTYIARRRHTFEYDQLLEADGLLHVDFILSPDVMPETVIRNAILPTQIIDVFGGAQSMLATGDAGSPLLQNDCVVAIANGWDLFKASCGSKDVHILSNTFTPLAPHMAWIDDIITQAA